MADILSKLQAPEGATTSKRRIGRGTGSGLGKTAGRGQKGQKARSKGNINKLHFQGGQTPMQRRLPKRGFRNPFPTEVAIVAVGALERFDAQSEINDEGLRKAGLVSGSYDKLKILGDGELTRALTVVAHAFSKSAREKIEKAGGKVVEIKPVEKPAAPEAPAAKPKAKAKLDPMVLANLANVTRVPELRRRLLFTLAMLAVYRIGVFITTPGVNRSVMKSVVASKGTGLLGFLNLFSGGALENLSIFALGIMPYISTSIIMSLLGMVYKPIEELRKEGEQGRRKIDQYTRMGTIVLSTFQAFGIATMLEGMQSDMGEVVGKPGIAFRLMTILTLTTGTAFLMWVGEQISERGISNGISLLIFAGIITDIPGSIGNYLDQNKGNVQPLTVAAVSAVILATVATIVFFERAQRRIPIVYSRRQVGKRIYGGQQAHLPLKVNSAGTIPPIFASSLLMFPTTLAQLGVWGMSYIDAFINRGGWMFNTGYTLLIIFFCFFYTAVTFQAVDVADNLKKQQANIPGIRPGKQTADYIDRVLTRITFGGALYVAAVCIIPQIVTDMFRVPFRFGGTSIMIVVGVALDTVNQIEAQLITKQYEGFGGGVAPKLRGRRETST